MAAETDERMTGLPGLTHENIRIVAEIEDEFLAKRSHGERLGDAVAQFSGSATFFVINASWYLAWIFINSGVIPGIRPFDPYPFTFLTLMVSLEAIFLAIFVLASQNRMSRMADQRAHMNFQVDLLAEQENTKMLEFLQRMAAHLGMEEDGQDEEVRQLTEKTEAKEIRKELEEHLPQK